MHFNVDMLMSQNDLRRLEFITQQNGETMTWKENISLRAHFKQRT